MTKLKKRSFECVWLVYGELVYSKNSRLLLDQSLFIWMIFNQIKYILDCVLPSILKIKKELSQLIVPKSNNRILELFKAWQTIVADKKKELEVILIQSEVEAERSGHSDFLNFPSRNSSSLDELDFFSIDKDVSLTMLEKYPYLKKC